MSSQSDGISRRVYAENCPLIEFLSPGGAVVALLDVILSHFAGANKGERVMGGGPPESAEHS
jgi:hypothetical protein